MEYVLKIVDAQIPYCFTRARRQVTTHSAQYEVKHTWGK